MGLVIMDTLSSQQIDGYLQRLDYEATLPVSVPTLNALHKAHMLHVPFENLDIAVGKEIQIDATSVYNKLILQRRGGFCYELNHGFGLLLHSLGFDVEFLAARVYQGEDLGPLFDHMLLSVLIDETKYFADVGFGDSFTQVLTSNKGPLLQGNVWYDIRPDEKRNSFQLWQKSKEEWQAQYLFSLNSFDVGDFGETCHYHQTSPHSPFTRKSVCSIATENGRKTISNGRFIVSQNQTRQESAITSIAEYEEILQREFSVVLDDSTDIGLLLNRQ